MCTWAGYIGTQSAFRNLMDSATRIEGLWSGHYSGMATLDATGFHHDKVMGHLGCLQPRVSEPLFPGRIGLFHSRTGSGGDARWAQPFKVCNPSLVALGQGSPGRLNNEEGLARIGNELWGKGFRFESASPPVGRYPRLSHDQEVHSTEIVSVAVAAAVASGDTPVQAIRDVLSAHAGECAYAFLLASDPDHLYIGNINQRVVVGRNETGTFISNTQLAFPMDVSWTCEIPGNTTARIGKDEIRLWRLTENPERQPDESVPPGLEEAFLAYVEAHPDTSLAPVVDNALAPLFEPDRLQCRAAASQRTLERLLHAGQLELRTREVPGPAPEAPARRTGIFSHGFSFGHAIE